MIDQFSACREAILFHTFGILQNGRKFLLSRPRAQRFHRQSRVEDALHGQGITPATFETRLLLPDIGWLQVLQKGWFLGLLSFSLSGLLCSWSLGTCVTLVMRTSVATTKGLSTELACNCSLG